jgi:ABC-type multidrug transport system permease subunit
MLPLHIPGGVIGLVNTGIGLTVIVTVCGVPVQVVPPFVKLGVTVIVATTGVDPGLIAINDAISPVPLAANPIEG